MHWFAVPRSRRAASSSSARATARGWSSSLAHCRTHGVACASSWSIVRIPLRPGRWRRSRDGRVNFSCCVRRDVLERARALRPGAAAGEALLAYVHEQNRHAGAAMARAQRVSSWLACGPLRPGVRAPGIPGVHAIGNAAAEVHPLVGGGVSHALQSAAMLCSTLMSTGAQASASSGFPARWRAQQALRVKLSACYAHAAMRPAWTAAVAAMLARVPGLVALGARCSGNTSTYVFSSTSTATR